MVQIYKCLRCGHEWAGRKDTAPVKCSKCYSPYWNKPKVKQSGPDHTGGAALMGDFLDPDNQPS